MYITHIYAYTYNKGSLIIIINNNEKKNSGLLVIQFFLNFNRLLYTIYNGYF